VQARDWEAISRGPGRTLWLGDIGDNNAVRDRGLLVHRIAEPDGATNATLPSTRYRLRYEDGPRDAEALLVTPRTGQVLVVEKTYGSTAGVYAADLPLRPGGVVNVLHRVAEVHVPSVTGGDISPDGTRVVLRNYTAAYEWAVSDGDVVAALRRDPVRIALPRTEQGEGITYASDGRSLLTSSEGVGAPVYELRRLGDAATQQRSPSAPDASRSAAAPAPTSSARPEPGTSGWRVPLTAAGVALACALIVTALRRRR
jgi:hypothetical protein